MKTSLIISLGLMASLSSALGINCRGSANCRTFVPSEGKDGRVIDQLIDKIYSRVTDNNRFYSNGEYIACLRGFEPYPDKPLFGGVCAFPQKTRNGITGKEVRDLSKGIRGHKCRSCGSITVFPEVNDANTHGELTFNYVDQAKISDGDA